MAAQPASSGQSNSKIDDLYLGTIQNNKYQNRICAKNDLSKKLMVHYQKKYSIYSQKNSHSTEEKEYQVKGSIEAGNKQPCDSNCSC